MPRGGQCGPLGFACSQGLLRWAQLSALRGVRTGKWQRSESKTAPPSGARIGLIVVTPACVFCYVGAFGQRTEAHGAAHACGPGDRGLCGPLPSERCPPAGPRAALPFPALVRLRVPPAWPVGLLGSTWWLDIVWASRVQSALRGSVLDGAPRSRALQAPVAPSEGLQV